MISLTPEQNRDHPVPDEVAAAVVALTESGEKYINAWNKLFDEVARGRAAVNRGGNMFITDGKTFNEFCAWIFEVLGSVRKQVGDKPEVEASWRRYCAYIGERLLSVYIEANQLPSLGVPMRFQKWWLPYVRAIANKFKLDRQSKLYIALSNR